MTSIAKSHTNGVAPILLDWPQTCEALGMSEGAIRNAMCRTVDPLPSIKIGDSRRFPVRELTEWCARRVGSE